MKKWLAAAFLAVVLSLLQVSGSLGQEGKEGPLGEELDWDKREVTWHDFSGEESYRVSGAVTYWPRGACGVAGTEGAQAGKEIFVLVDRKEFSQGLPSDATSFSPPSSGLVGETFIKDISYTIEALGSRGEVLALDGATFTVDPTCVDEFAVVGSGPGGGRTMLVSLVGMVLAVAASLSILGLVARHTMR